MTVIHQPRLSASHTPLDVDPIPACRRCGCDRETAPRDDEGRVNPYCKDCRSVIRTDRGYLGRLAPDEREDRLGWVVGKPRGVNAPRSVPA